MAIIYSYPIDTTPETGDLLIGTSIADGNATKSYTIASLVGLTNTQGGTGTVQSVSTTDSTFITIQGGPITGDGTLVALLSAAGTPSETTFLRGDNKWMPATSTGSAQITVSNKGDQITSDVDSINFTGLGVTAELTTGTNDVVVNIEEATSAVTSLAPVIPGIALSSTVGNVTITNTGVTSIVAGANVTIASTGVSGTGTVTLNAINNPGTVQSVIAGDGLQVTAGTNTVNPSIGVETTGSNNYILRSKVNTPIISTDFIPYNQTSSNNIKTTTLSTIPITALPLIKTYIDAGDAGSIKNSTDTYTSTAVINNVVTILASTYNAGSFVPNPNTLYILDAGAGTTPVTVTLNTVNGISSGVAGTAYDITGNVTGNQLSGVPGEAYTFTSIITPKEDFYFTVPASGMVVQGVFPGASATVTQNLGGTVAAAPIPSITATLLVVANIQGGPADGSGFTITGSQTNAISVAPANSASLDVTGLFTTGCSANTGFTFPVAPTITPPTNTINGSQTVVTTITGTLQAT